MRTRALVVGGSSEIGAACARVLADLGHDVVLWGRDPDRLAAAADTCGGSTRTVELTDRTALAGAAAVRFVLTFPGPGCPTEVVLSVGLPSGP